MRHNYRSIFSYNPVKKEVITFKGLGEGYLFKGFMYDEIFYRIWAISNHTEEVVLGLSISGDMYQLSPASYGTYVKEDLYSAQTIPKGAVLAAISKYKSKHNIPFDEE